MPSCFHKSNLGHPNVDENQRGEPLQLCSLEAGVLMYLSVLFIHECTNDISPEASLLPSSLHLTAKTMGHTSATTVTVTREHTLGDTQAWPGERDQSCH